MRRALDGASFALEAGHTLGLVGESGSGKSLLCATILGLQPKNTKIAGGEILFEGQDLLTRSESEMRLIRGREIGLILEDPNNALDPAFNVRTQVGEASWVHQGVLGRDMTREAVTSLRYAGVPEPERHLGLYPHQLSPGMRQRVATAAAISCRPKLLVADEPTSTLDATIQAQYLHMLSGLRQELGLSIILATHDFGIVAAMCDRVAVMYAGDVIEQGTVREIFTSPAHPYTAALLRAVPSVDRKPAMLDPIAGQFDETVDELPGCRFAPRCSFVTDHCLQRRPPQLYIGPGHFSSCYHAPEILKELAESAPLALPAGTAPDAPPQPEPAPAESVLAIKDLGKTFHVRRAKLRAVDGVSFDLPAGQTFALAGETGCGKSTLSHMVLHLEHPSDGVIEWQGSDVWRLAGDRLREYRRTVQAVFQDPLGAMNPRFTVGQFVAEPLLLDHTLSAKDREAKVSHALELVGLSEWDASLPPREFAPGQRQRIALARALVTSPRLIVLDEPVSLLDVSIRPQIMNLLKELQDSLGLAYLLIANHLGVVRYLAHRMAVMYLGRIVEIGPAESLFQKPLHPYTRALINASLPATAGVELADPVKGEAPDLAHLGPGCRFAPRCPHVKDICREQDPELRDFGGRQAACHIAETFAASPRPRNRLGLRPAAE